MSGEIVVARHDLPDPQTLAAAQVPALIALLAPERNRLRELRDVAGADDLRRRFAAYGRYVADKKAKKALEAEERRTEILIGELLGPPPGKGANQGLSHDMRKLVIHPQHHADFYAESQHPDVVEAHLTKDVTARAKILNAITRAGFAANTPADEPATRLGDFRDALADLPDESVDLIFTDPPYAREHVGDYADIAEFGARVLKPGASLLAYCGQYALPEILDGMAAHLRYWWLCACVHTGSGGRNHRSLPGIKAYVIWKPIVWFVKGTNGATDFVQDAILRSGPVDKSAHDWQQELDEPLHYIAKLCPPDGLVVDPFAGGGTTQVACRELGRRFIGSEINEETRAIAEGRMAS